MDFNLKLTTYLYTFFLSYDVIEKTNVVDHFATPYIRQIHNIFNFACFWSVTKYDPNFFTLVCKIFALN